MRDPNRITKCMNILTKVWQKQPDTRFNQLVENLKYEFYNDTNKGVKRNLLENDRVFSLQVEVSVIDLFHIEDDQFFDWLEKKYTDKICKFAWVDKDTCIACGNCSSTAPDIFGYDKEGHAENIYNKDKNTGSVGIPESMHDDLFYASEGCPTESIKVSDKPKP
ncbi:Ferredoxin [compost metagenome]